MATKLEAYEKVALSKGATFLELHQATEKHLADPEARREIKGTLQTFVGCACRNWN